MQTSKFSLVADAAIDGKSFLARTIMHGDSLGRIDAEKSETLSDDIAALAHKLITMKVDDLSDTSELRKQIQTSFALTSLGLEFGSKGNLDKAVNVILANPIVKFFQIGNTLSDKLITKASYLLENALIHPSEELEHLDIDSIRIYNFAEAEFLNALSTYHTTISAAQFLIQNTHQPKSINTLSDLETIRQQLDYIEARWTYVQALPLDQIFSVDPPFSIEIDPIRKLTLNLMSNLTLFFKPEFQIEPDTLEDFKDIIYDDSIGEIRTAPRQRLIDWIEEYLKQDSRNDDVINYSVSYWDSCLQSLINPESEIVGEISNTDLR